MNRKLARRMWKLKEFVDSGNSATLGCTKDIITRVANTIDQRWAEIRKEYTKTPEWVAPTQDAIQQGLTFTLGNNQTYLQAVVQRTEKLARATNYYDDVATSRSLVSACSTRLVSDSVKLPTSINTTEVELGMMDFEAWVEKQLPLWSASPSRSTKDCAPLASIMKAYAGHGMSEYAKAPERMSVLWLTLMELWVTFDKLVVNWDNLMARFSPEIPETFLDPLLLPSSSQLKRLDAVQSYLRQRHNSASNGSIFGDISSRNSFQNLYFKQSPNLKDEKRRILDWGEEEKEMTLEAMHEHNEKYENLMSEYNRLSCEYHTSRNRWGHDEQRHSDACRKCSLYSQASSLETPRFEEPLPTSPYRANPIVFELNCPPVFGLWREITHRLLTRAFDYTEDQQGAVHLLSQYSPLDQFFKSTGREITIASSAVSIATCYSGNPKHYRASVEDVIFPHAGNYHLCFNGGWLKARGKSRLRQLCTLQLDDPYRELKIFIENTTHTSNHVIASQSKCPASLGLGEYLAFGHLRAGNDIQVRNVMRALLSDSLSFNEPAVHSLILQTIWQAGPNRHGQWYRDAHQDFADKQVAHDMLVSLRRGLDKIGDSGREVLHIATLIALAARLLSLSIETETRATCFSFLEDARKKVMKWMTVAEGELESSTDDDSSRIQHKIALIAVTLRLTFDVDSEVLNTLCESPANLEVLLVSQLQIAADGTQHASLPNGIQLLFRRGRRLAHRLEPYISSALKANDGALHDAIKRVWNGYQRGSQWTPLQGNGTRWWKCVTNRTQHFVPLNVFVNILTGDMLVNGRTVDRLPSTYINRETYESLFGRKITMRSRPSTMRGMEYEATFKGMQIHFATINNSLIIRLFRDGRIEEFIPPTQLRGDMSSIFLQDKFHWYVEEGSNRAIQFRPRESQWNFEGPGIWTMDLQSLPNTSLRGRLHLKSSVGTQMALDPHSSAFKSLHDAIKGMEVNRLDVSVISTPSGATQRSLVSVSLLNRGLEFILNEKNRIESRSFPGYALDTNLDIGCLYGLVDRLVLCDLWPSQRVRKVLIPRGDIQVVSTNQRYPMIRVQTAKKAGFHAYDVDELVGRLIGNGTMESDLFLIQLHAFTASHCPDPLTNRTGTEEALDLLTSSSLLSHHTASKEWRQQLEKIAALTPHREYYPKGMKVMERIRWNEALLTTSQHPEFENMVSSIISYWSDIDLRNSGAEHYKPLQLAPGMLELNRRAALRDLRTTHAYSALQKHNRSDHRHAWRDVVQCTDSQQREIQAYKTAFCARYLAAGLPVYQDLEKEAQNWNSVQPNQSWTWSHLPQWFNGSTSNIWCTLYKLCCHAPRGQGPLRFELSMALSMMGYKGSIPVQILGTLVAIARDSRFSFFQFEHDLLGALQLTYGSEFKESGLRNLVKSKEVGFDRSPESSIPTENAPGNSHNERLRWKRDQYDRNVISEVDQIVSDLRQLWNSIVSGHPATPVRETTRTQGIVTLVNEKIQPLMTIWGRNRRFFNHLAAVNRQVRQTPSVAQSFVPYRPQRAPFSQPQIITDLSFLDLLKHRNAVKDTTDVPTAKTPLSIEESSVSTHEDRVLRITTLVEYLDQLLRGKLEKRYKDDFLRSVEAFTQAPPQAKVQVPPMIVLDTHRQSQQDWYYALRDQIMAVFRPSSNAETLLEATGLWPRVTSLTLLSRLSLEHRNATPDNWITVISLYANQIIAVQQSRRLCLYGAKNMAVEYNREVLHSRQRQLSGDPDWLLVEIDADVSIRSDQVDVANSMMYPENGENTVMQLNMGEGKSSVIVPIVSATLADRKKLVRVVVLKPQSKLQLNLLRRRLAKLVNRRVICLSFNRDLKVGPNTAEKISRILSACRDNGGIWLCQPEHLLSFKLLGLDLAMRGATGSGITFDLIKCQLWMQQNTRDILDESDEILNTRHQLIYTVGDQTTLDAAPARWEIVQDMLSLMHSELASQPSPHFLVEPAEGAPGHFPTIRLMSEQGNEFFNQLARKIVFKNAIPSIRTARFPLQLKNAAVSFITQRDLPANDPEIESLKAHCEGANEDLIWQSLLLIRGLIAFAILPLALRNKRWRVDYGHDLRRSQLAVPYRAKDSPSLRSDFAHPDVLVLLTCMTYYYSGLNDEMIVRAVKELLKSDNPELIYDQWLSSCIKEIPSSLHKLADINVDDDKMIARSLRPYIHRNKRAIDFFLNQCVFPKEAKAFPFKMSASGWDLAMLKPNPTTGFSGTNDSRFLLPTSIVQADSPAQKHTNATVIAHILQEENDTVISHDNNLTSEQLLDVMLSLNPRPTVLLDVGAQILDNSNMELVRVWLSKYGENDPIKAAVYFDDNDNMCILERDGSSQLFTDSPFSNRLEECVVYLDDSHTRGTDLKLPACRAAVTLGPRLYKDKLVQGCMRMRKLGSEQSLVFLAPDEVVKGIKKVVGDDVQPLKSAHVLIWTMKETCQQLQINVSNWATQGYEFAERQSGWNEVSREPKNREELKYLFCQEDGRTLAQMYGVSEQSLARDGAHQKLPSPDQLQIEEEIQQHCKLFNAFSLEDARADEEQEVELVHEQEVEREVERPPPAGPAEHSVHPHVKHFVDTGHLVLASPAFRTVKQSLEQTSLVFPSGGASAFSELLVTSDFYRTVQQTNPDSNVDDFLRPLEWVVTTETPNGSVLVGFSPYEVNELLEQFRTSTKVKLHLFAPRNSLAMQTLENLQLFTLPTTQPTTPLPSHLSQQLNLYSGALYLSNFKSYNSLCTALRLHFGEVAAGIAERGVINSNGFVKDATTRMELGLVGDGFDEDPVQFFRKLLHLRRNRRSFLPSHMGQILFSGGLSETDFA
ncbi:hypothetical protein M408DRAFT_130685 [Serendipita vermifera MAFF 305830]|uniref:ubiquitinyl hydrolase 1 n=1 Tax=Serendipita vermifera MAFF 305830 TaxID=933852 RepID=A0A0C2WSM5_SERVB|nr:hypothetical protein M408DRAFT_130685 [Serendipita vermifera MAFF 305830]